MADALCVALPLFVQPAIGRLINERKPCNSDFAADLSSSGNSRGEVDERKHEFDNLEHRETFTLATTMT